MVYESYPWKQDLLCRKRLILKYNTVDQFNRNEDAAYTVLEKAVFYSAFIIRKLIDCKNKLSDEADKYVLRIESFTPLREINSLHNWPDNNTYDWEHPRKGTIEGKKICNSLIHSLVFFFNYNEEGTVVGFYVSSDFDRNKVLYYISVDNWLQYMTFVANDSVVAMDSHYDKAACDYVYTKKKRESINHSTI